MSRPFGAESSASRALHRAHDDDQSGGRSGRGPSTRICDSIDPVFHPHLRSTFKSPRKQLQAELRQSRRQGIEMIAESRYLTGIGFRFRFTAKRLLGLATENPRKLLLIQRNADEAFGARCREKRQQLTVQRRSGQGAVTETLRILQELLNDRLWRRAKKGPTIGRRYRREPPNHSPAGTRPDARRQAHQRDWSAPETARSLPRYGFAVKSHGTSRRRKQPAAAGDCLSGRCLTMGNASERALRNPGSSGPSVRPNRSSRRSLGEGGHAKNDDVCPPSPAAMAG